MGGREREDQPIGERERGARPIGARDREVKLTGGMSCPANGREREAQSTVASERGGGEREW
jgi:hypothetical protein